MRVTIKRRKRRRVDRYDEGARRRKNLLRALVNAAGGRCAYFGCEVTLRDDDERRATNRPRRAPLEGRSEHCLELRLELLEVQLTHRSIQKGIVTHRNGDERIYYSLVEIPLTRNVSVKFTTESRTIGCFL